MPYSGIRPAVAIALVFLCLAAPLHAAGPAAPVPLAEWSKSSKVSVSWDPLTGSGLLERNGGFVGFTAGQPFMVLDFKTLKRVQAPFMNSGQLMLPADFIAEADGFFALKNPRQKEKYSVATILIDPGHGGKDTGAIGEVNGLRLLEKDLTLEVSRRVMELLTYRYPDRRILATREGDSYPTLEERVAMANAVGLKDNEAVIYVSIHANASFNRNARGFEVWYLNPEYRRTVVDAETVKKKGSDIAPILNAMLEEEFTTESIILARKVYDRLKSSIGDASPGRGIRAEEWFVVRNANMPSILIEMGFITHPEEGSLMSASGYLRKIGDAIYNGIVDFVDHFEG
jgi:N-acetylmuramoyl-L-alanine amidase